MTTEELAPEIDFCLKFESATMRARARAKLPSPSLKPGTAAAIKSLRLVSNSRGDNLAVKHGAAVARREGPPTAETWYNVRRLGYSMSFACIAQHMRAAGVTGVSKRVKDCFVAWYKRVSPKTIDNADQRKSANLSSMFLAFSAAVQNSRPGRGSARAPPGGVRVRQRFLRVGALWCFCHGSFRCSHSATSRTPSGCWVFLVGSFKIFLRWCFVGAFFLSGSGFLLSNFSRIFRRIIDE